jgi:hypothetical protein
MMITYEEIENSEEALNDMRERYLRQKGWENKCGNPGSIWLWCKTLDGKDYTCGKETAIHLQSSFDGER